MFKLQTDWRALASAFFTLGLLALAGFGARGLWNRYMDGPWTRDGRVRADVVAIAPDVSGLVAELAVHDNQFVHRGDVLFCIDPVRFRQALQQSDAELAQRQTELDRRTRENARRADLDDEVIAREARDDAALEQQSAQARRDGAMAALTLARVNLERTVVRAPVDGWITNLALREGEYIQAGQARLALLDRHSFYVYGYFEENRLPSVHPGDAARITLLGESRELSGHVDSIARGITDRDNATGGKLLADVNPSFSWVRLAQRIPVRIRIDQVPEGIELAAGMSCAVRLEAAQAKP